MTKSVVALLFLLASVQAQSNADGIIQQLTASISEMIAKEGKL